MCRCLSDKQSSSFAMSWKSPGPEDSRGSPEHLIAGNDPLSEQSCSTSEEDRIDPSSTQLNAPLVLQPLHPLQQIVTTRDEGEASTVRGGSQSQHQSRLFGYISPSSAGQISLPQSYPPGQPQGQPSSFQPLRSANDTSSFEQQVGQPQELSAGLPLLSTSYPEALPLSQGAPLQHVPQSWGLQLSQPPVPYTQMSIRHLTPHPQIPGSQTLLPSITSLSLDTSAQVRVAKSPRSYNVCPLVNPPTASERPLVSPPPSDLNPVPQNLRGDPFRSAKVKTELCKFFSTPKGCIFGAKCNYAHGDDELKFNKLMDLEAAGLIDVEVFRCHVCFTWVATGACPFDQRCTRLHDPRHIGTQPAWLPHAEVLVNDTKKGQEVDKLYHQQFCAIYNCSPVYGFAPTKRWRADEISTNNSWKELYSFCCNLDANQPYSPGAQWLLSTRPIGAAQDVVLTEMNRLAVALMMRERRRARHFVYLPTHIFCGELCFVLQTSYFILKVIESAQDIHQYQVLEISQEEAFGSHIIIAREIAFGPVADASVRPVSVWFNIDPDDIIQCTRQQARRHRRSRHRLRSKRNIETQPEEVMINASCSIPPYICHQPMDDSAFNLVTGIQKHRYHILKYFSSRPDDRALRSLALEEEMLRKSFESQRRFWMTWSWPKKIGSRNVDNDTEVPAVDGAYNFVTYGHSGYGEDSIFFGSDQQDRSANESFQVVSKQATLATGFVWRSFVLNLQLTSGRGAVILPKEEAQMPSHAADHSKTRRIPTLRDLSLGRSAVQNSSRGIPSLNPLLCTAAPPVVISLDVLIREWKVKRRQYEENSAHPLQSAKQGKARHPDLAECKPIKYPIEEAAQSWNRMVPNL